MPKAKRPSATSPLTGEPVGAVARIPPSVKRKRQRAPVLGRYELQSGLPGHDTVEVPMLLLTKAGKKAAADASGCDSLDIGERFLHDIAHILDVGMAPSTRMRRVEEACAWLANPLEAAAAGLARQLFILEAQAMNELTAVQLTGDPGLKAYHANRAARLLRSYTSMFAALSRHRAQGQPRTMRIEHVYVAPGGQAIVGVVDVGRGQHKK